LPLHDDRRLDLCDLRRFGLALTRDDRFVAARSAAEALVERLFRQASMEIVDFGARSRSNRQGAESERTRAFGQFIRLYRRHLRRLACEESETGWEESAPPARGGAPAAGVGVAAAVRMLPLELREALLIVVLARFSYQDAALALDIPLACLMDRLTLARDRLASLTRGPAEAGTAAASSRIVSHLRVVK
jgi:DNA-directed RNA polymerase specialized sigma24 family protein